MEWIRLASRMLKGPRRAWHPVISFQHGRCHLVALPHKHWTQQDQRDPISWELSSHSLDYKQSTFSSSCLEQLRTEATSGLKVCIYLGFLTHIFHKTQCCSHFSTVLSLGFGLQSTSTNMSELLIGKRIHEILDCKKSITAQTCQFHHRAVKRSTGYH